MEKSEASYETLWGKLKLDDISLHNLENSGSLREFVRNLKEGIYITSETGDILDVNPAMLQIFGLASVEEFRKHKTADFWVDPVARAKEMEILARDGAVREFELQIRSTDGTIRTLLDTCYAVRIPETGEKVFHGILVDITERKKLELQLHEQSLRDPLTGCFNRRYMGEFEKRKGMRQWGCIVIDVDHFKDFNDSFGHAAGDEALVKLTRFLSQQVRAEEGVVRMGGDEFLILLPHADEKITRLVADRLRTGATERSPVSFSMGWATRLPGEDLEKTVARADDNLLSIRVSDRSYSPGRRKPQ